MKKKVKKFGRGGDVLTAAGAILLGKHLYDKYKEGKDDSDYARKVKEFRSKEDTAKPAEEPKTATKAEPKEETREEYLEKRGAKRIKETDTRENTLYKEDEPKKVVTTTPKGTAPAVKKAAPYTGVVPAKDLGSQSFSSESLKSKPYPQAEATARLKKAEAERRAGQGLTPRAEYTGPGSRQHVEALKLRRSQQLEEEAKKQFEKNKRENEGMKRGGKVKKYAEGGTATSKPEPKKKDTMPEWAKTERENRRRDELNKRESEGAAKEVKRNMSTFGFKKGGSASSRADGIAIRGKTRA
jgi:hypothetical protein